MNLYYLINIFEMFNRHKAILDELVIPDISNIVVYYLKMFSCVEKFNYKFIGECIQTGKFQYYNSDKLTLIHYMIKYSYWGSMAEIFKNHNGEIKAEHFQNRDKYNNTELYLMCYYEKYEMIKKFKGLDAKYFQNKCRYGKTELALLIEEKYYDIILSIKGLNASHFQNKDHSGNTELSLLCKNKEYNIINNIEGLNALHFQNKNNSGNTELSIICENKGYALIKSLYNNHDEKFRLKACHFINNVDNYTELQLLGNNIYIIKFLVDNLKIKFTDFITKRGYLSIKDETLVYVIKTLKMDKDYLILHRHILPLICGYNMGAIGYLLDNTDIKFEDFLYNDLFGHDAIYNLFYNRNLSVNILQKIRGLPKKCFIDNIKIICNEYNRYKKNISDIVIYFIDKFNLTAKDFCKNKETNLIRYFCRHNFLVVMQKLEGLIPDYFQNIDGKDTELYILCANNNWEMIQIIVEKFPNENGFLPKHFKNRNSGGNTELYKLFHPSNRDYNSCIHKPNKIGTVKIIKCISENFPNGTYWDVKQFLYKGSIAYLCQPNMEDTLKLIEKYCGKEFHWYPKHFNIKDNIHWRCDTIVATLCENKMSNFIKYITNNFIKYNTNKNKSAWKLEWVENTMALKHLCQNNMGDDIKLIIMNCPKNINLYPEYLTEIYYLAINNMGNTFKLFTDYFPKGVYWKPEHFIDDTYNRHSIAAMCKNNMVNTIRDITNQFPKGVYWKPEHFIKNAYSKHSITVMCENNMVDTIRIITNQFPEGVYWKPEHFGYDHYCEPGTYNLIKNKQIQTLKSITEQFPEGVYWKPEHFMNGGGYNITKCSIYLLCINKMENTIKYITKNFDESTSWKTSLNEWKKVQYFNHYDQQYKLILQYLKQIDIK